MTRAVDKATRTAPEMELEHLEGLLERARSLESSVGALLHDLEAFLESTDTVLMPNARRAHQLVGVSHNALQGARSCLARRSDLSRASLAKGARRGNDSR